jgi:YtkA-like
MIRTTSLIAVVLMFVGWLDMAGAADLKVIKSQKAKDVSISLLNETGQWKPGKNEFVVAFTSTKDNSPVDVGKVTLNTSMPMPGMAPMIAGATLQPETPPGRYRGAINFADSGDRQVTVSWDGPAGKGSTKFTVPVR